MYHRTFHFSSKNVRNYEHMFILMNTPVTFPLSSHNDNSLIPAESYQNCRTSPLSSKNLPVKPEFFGKIAAFRSRVLIV